MQSIRQPTTRELVAAKQRAGVAPATPGTNGPTAVAVKAPDDRDYRSRYLDEVAPASVVGRMVKFSKEGAFVTYDDGEEVPEDAEFIALVDQTLIGWVKFGEIGQPPEREMGLLYDGFIMPERETLGDLDQRQ